MSALFFAPKNKKGKMIIMKTIKEYEAMDIVGQESFIAHACADLVYRMYYGNDSKGLEVLMKNLTTIISKAQDCIDCLDILRRDGDVYAKIYLLLDYAGKDGISEEFVGGLLELSERAQEAFAHNAGSELAADEEKEVLKRLNAVMNRNDIQANRELQQEMSATATKPNSASGKSVPTGTSAVNKNVAAGLSRVTEAVAAVAV